MSHHVGGKTTHAGHCTIRPLTKKAPEGNTSGASCANMQLSLSSEPYFKSIIFLLIVCPFTVRR